MGTIGNLQMGTIWAEELVIGGSGVDQSTGYVIRFTSGGEILSGTSLTFTQLTTGSLVGNILSGTKILASNETLAGSIVSPTYSGTTVQASNAVLAGSAMILTVSGTTVQTSNILAAGSINTPIVINSPGSPYYQGNILQFSAETIITGGMWVTVSGAAGGASVKAKAAAASSQGPMGVAVATVASGATVSVLARGLTYLTAEGTVNNAQTIKMGAGAKLNTVAAAADGSGARGVALAGAGSEGLVLAYLW